MNQVRAQAKTLNYFWAFIFVFTILNTWPVFAGPSRTTYQAKIVKPDGYPLEVSNVNFKFTILDPAGSCILYSETYSAVNMSGTGGLISFALGSGVKTYPASATTFENVFSNVTPSLSCDAGGPPSYSPASSDIRKIVMQFHDGSGWQTLPAMSINAVPYAMYANDALKLNGKTDADFVHVTSVPTCAVSEALHYNGAMFSCVATGETLTSSGVVSALGYTPATEASYTTVTSDISAVSSTVAGVSNYASSVSATVTSLQNSVAASFAAITSSQWSTMTSGITYTGGNVGVGTATPMTKLDVSGGVRIGMDAASCATGLAGTLRYNAGAVEYCNGTSWLPFGVAGAGITNINGSVSGTQTFATGITGTVFNISSANGVHTFNIPLAASSSVAAGLLSNADYLTFTNKLNATSAAVISALGFTPADNAALGTYAQKANNLSDLSSATAARTNLGLGSLATLNFLDLSSAQASGTLAAARLPAFSGDATSPLGSSILTLASVGSGVTSGTQYTKVTVDGKGRVVSGAQLSVTDVTAALGYTPAQASSSTQWTTSGSVIFYNTGNIGMGTATPATRLEVSGGVKISMESAACASSYAGTLRYNGGNVEYCNGSTWTAFGAATVGVNSLNGSASQTQSFANGTTGNAPAFSTANGIHTLNIPLASAGSVTAGLISNADYTSFANKITSSAAAISQVLGYAPVSTTTLSNYVLKANNLSDLTNVATARTNLGLGTFATASTIDLGSASATGTLAIARLPSFTGDATVAAASNTIILANSGVAAGTYTKVTVDNKGRVTSGAQLTNSDVTTALGYTPANSATVVSSQWTTSGSAIYYNSGNVGINTTSPWQKFDVSGTAAANLLHLGIGRSSGGYNSISETGTGVKGRIYFGADNTDQASIYSEVGSGSETGLVFEIKDDPTDYFSFVNQSGPIMRLYQNGSMGLGVQNPTAVLHLKAGTSSTASLKFTSGTLLASPQAGAMEYDGSNYYVTDGAGQRRTIATGSSQGSIDNASNINSTGNIVMNPNNGSNSVIVSSTVASTSSNTGALVVNGGLGVAGAINASGSITTSSNIQGVSVTATSGMISPYIAGSIVSGGGLTLDSTTHATKGKILLAPNGGNVGIGTTTPSTAFHVAGSSSSALVQVANALTSTAATAAFFQPSLSSANGTGIIIGRSATSNDAGWINYYHDTTQANRRIGIGHYGAMDKLSILNNGNVGVGTTSPQHELQIGEGSTTNPPTLAFKGHATDGFGGKIIFEPEDGSDRFTIDSELDGTTGNDLLKFNAANASNVLVLKGNGNVGIGTSAPTYRLHVTGDIGVQDIYSSQGQFDIVNSSGVGLSIVGAPGNVGIGTTAPATKLDVVGEIRSLSNSTTGQPSFFTATNSVNESLQLKFTEDAVGTVPADYWQFRAGGSARGIVFAMYDTPAVTINTGRDVGVGIEPATRLHVFESVTMGAVGSLNLNNAVLRVQEASGTSLNFDGNTIAAEADLFLGTKNVNNFHLFASDTTRIFISGSSGNVGVGTTSPGAKLEVVNSMSNSTEGITLKDSTTTNGRMAIGDATNGASSYVPVMWGKAEALTSGNRYGLMLIGEPAFDSTSDAAVVIDARFNSAAVASSPILKITNYNSEKMRVDVNGNVGIGTTAPSQKLDVTGTIRAGNNTATTGSVLLMDAYTSGSLTNFGTEYSSGGPMIGYGVIPSYATPASFLSSTPISNLARSAVNMSDSIRFYLGATQTVTTGSAVSLSEAMRITTAGVGIGTSTPSAKFQVSRNFNGESNTTAAFIGGYDAGYTNTGAYFVQKDNTGLGSSSTLLFNVVKNSASQFAITGTGAVGIGTTSPIATLHVAGTGYIKDSGNSLIELLSRSDSAFNVTNNSTTKRGFSLHHENSSAFMAQWYYCPSGACTQKLSFDYAGNMVIAGTLTQSSDIRLKKDILPLQNSLDKILSLNGVSYYWKDKEVPERQVGLIAQEVEKVFPEIIKKDEKGFLSVGYQNLVAPLIESMKELYHRLVSVEQKQIAQQREMASVAESKADKSELEKIKAENAALKAYICSKDPKASICLN